MNYVEGSEHDSIADMIESILPTSWVRVKEDSPFQSEENAGKDADTAMKLVSSLPQVGFFGVIFNLMYTNLLL